MQVPRLCARTGKKVEISPRRFGYFPGMAFLDSGEVYEIAADSEGTSTSMDEAGSRVESHASSGDQLEKREWSE